MTNYLVTITDSGDPSNDTTLLVAAESPEQAARLACDEASFMFMDEDIGRIHTVEVKGLAPVTGVGVPAVTSSDRFYAKNTNAGVKISDDKAALGPPPSPFRRNRP